MGKCNLIQWLHNVFFLHYSILSIIRSLNWFVHSLEDLNMSAHVLLNLLNELKEIKCEACGTFYSFFAMHLITSVVQEHEC